MSIPDNIIEEIIERANSKFDSHDIIHIFGHENQRLYISELAATNGDSPFKTLHSEIGRQIKSICDRHGYIGVASSSLDIFGQNSNCIQWSK